MNTLVKPWKHRPTASAPSAAPSGYTQVPLPNQLEGEPWLVKKNAVPEVEPIGTLLGTIDHNAANSYNAPGNTSGETSEKESVSPEPIVKLDERAKKSVGSFYAIQEWEGYVTKIAEGIVFADLVDLVPRNETRPSFQAEIPIHEFADDEAETLAPGSVFRWSIGYYRYFSGRKDRLSRIRCRKLPTLLAADEAAIEKETREFGKLFHDPTNS
jgi:hypothetical protein